MKYSARLREAVLYLIFGMLTTAVNVAVYAFLYPLLGNMGANLAAWAAAVCFAFFTNKKWVFSSGRWDLETVLKEAAGFTACRLATGALDMAVMFAGVSICRLNPLVMKVLSNVIVIVLNYAASKRLIFKHGGRR